MAAKAQGKIGSPIYLAGPMFSIADKAQMDDINRALKSAGYTTYNPHKDGLEIATVMSQVNKGLALPAAEVLDVVTFAHKLVFALDVYQLIERCQAVVFNLDGRVPDDGSVSESAIAFASNKPVVIFKTTPIAELAGWDNPLVQGLSTEWSYVNTVAKIAPAVGRAVRAMNAMKAVAGPAPAQRLGAVVELGAAVWGATAQLQAASAKTPKQIYATVVKMQKQFKPLMDKAF